MHAQVVAVHASAKHRFSKQPQGAITLLENIGVEGDAHAGITVQHLYDKRYHPQKPNLRQVHLIHEELLDSLAAKGFMVAAGELGENITTRGIDLLHLPTGAELHLGDAVLRLTGLRAPCVKMDRFMPGLMAEMVADKAAKRFLSGVMSVVVRGGEVRPGDLIRVQMPDQPHLPLRPV